MAKKRLKPRQKANIKGAGKASRLAKKAVNVIKKHGPKAAAVIGAAAVTAGAAYATRGDTPTHTRGLKVGRPSITEGWGPGEKRN